MAAVSPTFPSSKETTNYARLCVLLVDVGSQVLEETFERRRPPGRLDTVRETSPTFAALKSLQKRKIMNPSQWSSLYPTIKSSVSSKNFDITLLMMLIRNICELTPPATGWGALPSTTDLSREADIARIKCYRNTVYGHATQASVDDATFDDHWINIRDTLVRLGEAAYEAAIDDLKYDSLDPNMEEHYKWLLMQWKMDEHNIKDKLDDVEARIDELKASVNKLIGRQLRSTSEMNSSKPRNELPEKEPNIYGRTKDIDNIVQALLEKSGKTQGVLVSGPAGVGKSTVAIHAGHRLKNEFEAIVKFCSLRGAYKAGGSEDDGMLREILNVCVPGHQQCSEYPRHVLLNWCRQLENELILIVDNVDHATEGRHKYDFLNLLSDMRMRSDCKIKFLLTSSSVVETVGTVSNIQLLKIGLNALDVEESIEVLKDGANLTSDADPDTEVKLGKIAQLCENNPLALRLADPLLAAESEYTFEELKQKLEQDPTRTLGIMPMMEIAFEKLDKSLKRALVCLSTFPRSFKRDAAEAILGNNCAEDLTNLKKRCLIQKQGDRYLIHLLIRSYTKQIGQGDEFGQILADGKQYYFRHFLSQVLRNAQKYWGKDSCKESIMLFNEERINLEYTLREVAGGQKKVQDCKELEDVVDACGQVAPYIDGCVPFKLSVAVFEGLLQFSQNQENVTKQVEILCLLYDASRRHGGDMQKSKGRIDQAIGLYNSNRPLFEQNSLSEAFYLGHYGRYLSQECERRVEAQILLQKALSIVERETVKHASLASTFDIGRVLGQMGHNARLGKRDNDNRPREALTYFQRALSFRQSHYGEHIVTALVHKDLAGIYLSMEDFGKAEENYKAAVRIFADMGMMKQKEAIPTYKNFGRCCEKSGKIDEARRKFEMGIEVADATIEGIHKWKVEINTNLALVLYKNYPDEVGKEKELSIGVFLMAKELKMEKWHQREKLKTFYQK